MKLSYFSCYVLVLMYVMTFITLCMLSNLVSSSFTIESVNPNFLSVTYFNQKLSLMCVTHIKIGYFCLLSSIILKNISLGHATRKFHILKLGSSKLARILSQLILFLLIINFLLIGIVNPGKISAIRALAVAKWVTLLSYMLSILQRFVYIWVFPGVREKNELFMDVTERGSVPWQKTKLIPTYLFTEK